MDLSAFYGVVSGINFTLLGLWWVAVRERSEIGVGNPAGRRMAYLVSLQFLIPGTVSLLSQVAPEEPWLWRGSFAVAGALGAVGSALLGSAIAGVIGNVGVGALLRWGAAATYLIVAIVAAVPGTTSRLTLAPLQVEAVLLVALVFLGVQAAWVVAMSPSRSPANRAAEG
jgi:hypothetical protein